MITPARTNQQCYTITQTEFRRLQEFVNVFLNEIADSHTFTDETRRALRLAFDALMRTMVSGLALYSPQACACYNQNKVFFATSLAYYLHSSGHLLFRENDVIFLD